jgi:hypothetical protein
LHDLSTNPIDSNGQLVVDVDADLEERSLHEGCGDADLAVIIQADVDLHRVVELEVGGLAIGGSTFGADRREYP